MVATHGPGWRLAACLVELIDQADRLAPHRSTLSDGSLGDADHQGRVSDHNPDASGDVLAVDLTDDPAGGCDATALVAHLVAVHDPRVKYLIHDATIWRSYPRPASGGRPELVAWQPEVYTGLNAHRKHAHISVLDTDAAKGNTARWFPPPQEDNMLQRPELIVVPQGGGGQWLVNTSSGLITALERSIPTSQQLQAVGVPAIEMDPASWVNFQAAMAKVRARA